MSRQAPRLLLLLILVLSLLDCKKEQPAEEAAGPPPEVINPGEMVEIAAGEFLMGSDVDGEGKPNKKTLFYPQHKVTLPAYWIDKWEVTNEEFLKFTVESDYKVEGDWRTFYAPGKERVPVTQITWDDAKAYCEWAKKRLPTEGEWEKAARGTDGREYPWGNEWHANKSNNHESGQMGLVNIGRYAGDVSPYGVRDTQGNVQEWVADELKAYPGGPADPAFKRGFKAARGASFGYKGSLTKIYNRGGYLPKGQWGTGCRCASDTRQ